MNRVILVGRLTRDPMLKKTQSGTSVVSFTMAVNRRISGQGQQTADFINCVAWNKTADLMTQYLNKGAMIGIEGRIQSRSYDDASGRRVYVTEVVAETVQFLDNNRGGGNANANVNRNANTFTQETPAYDNNNAGYTADQAAPADDFASDFASSDTLDIASDDLPF